MHIIYCVWEVVSTSVTWSGLQLATSWYFRERGKMIVISAVMSEEQFPSFPPLVAGLDVIVVKSLYPTLHCLFIKNSLHLVSSPCIKSSYKIGILGSLRRMHGLLFYEVCHFSCVSSQSGYRAPRRRNATAFVVIESEKGNQFMLAVLYKSVVLQTKVRFNKIWAIAWEPMPESLQEWDFTFVQGDATLKICKKTLIHSAPYLNLGGLVLFLGSYAHQSPRGDWIAL